MVLTSKKPQPNQAHTHSCLTAAHVLFTFHDSVKRTKHRPKIISTYTQKTTDTSLDALLGHQRHDLLLIV